MLTIAAPDAAETRSNGTFEALMWAMARPGEARDMGEAGLEPIVEALIDRECTVYADSPALAAMIAATGATPSPVAMADHLFLDGLDLLADTIGAIGRGTALYPDDGATVVALVAHGTGPRLRLSGPGIEGAREISIAVPPAFWALRAQVCVYPEGFDLLLVDGRSVIGIPRSTQVEVL